MSTCKVLDDQPCLSVCACEREGGCAMIDMWSVDQECG